MPETEMSWIKNKLHDLEEAMSTMADAFVTLARLEERHASVTEALGRAFAEIAKIQAEIRGLDQQIHEIEKNEPLQTLTSDWVTKAVWAFAGMAAMFVAKKMGVL